jgi:quinol monooxygenase YgiN
VDQRLVRTAELEIDPERLDDYLNFLREEIAASVALEPGVIMLHAVAETSAPHRIRILEVYASEEAYRSHIETPHFLKYKTATAEMVKHLRLVDVNPIILAAK